jgi:cytochrome b subunit of formate dehydrogenase
MNIFLIVIGAILLLICGPTFWATHTATKNQASWDEFYKVFQEKNLSVPEEVVYKLVCKMNFWFMIGVIFGLFLLTGGIILQITFK